MQSQTAGFPAAWTQVLRQYYKAAVTHTDSMIGGLLEGRLPRCSLFPSQKKTRKKNRLPLRLLGGGLANLATAGETGWVISF